ncbi:tetratricopeptide repeat-containing sensor histidine kinase [Chryseobacterium sp. 5_R23647]|uniref:tetratricopeptide repeat-containing sensor histidine kinase n=1 Tax=Chryseobacterium sp. 5_R23647 TaxID=2258964 RepID=UPI000E2255C9|nr:tetratricopeptide repeat-containing sensor histidine kinase [Chryseobacterium sp. 5_R23647]REC45736.1 ATP-binding protein [Chryseobacterium sp. 5_R23647]
MKQLYLFSILYLLFSCKEVEKKDNPLENVINKNYALAKEATNEKVAFKYYNSAKEEFLINKDSLMAGKSLVNMAIIMSNQGDYYGSQQVSIEANKILSPKKIENLEILSSNYNCLAIVSENLKQYDKAIEFYGKAIKLSNDTITKLAYFNNIGNSYLQKKEYFRALNHFKYILKSKKAKTNKVDYARLINNYAKANYLINKNYDPIPLYKESYNIRKQENDLSGQNYVLASFVEYYHNKDINKTRMYSNERYKVTKQMKNPDDQLEVLQNLIIQNPHDYLKYFNEFSSLNDSLKLARNSAKDQFALIRFETEESKAQNLKLQKDNTEKKYQIIKQQIFNYSISILSLIAGISGIIWYKKRKQRLLLESENKLKEQQLKTSKKVHDVVANGIYQVMTKIENQNDFNKEQALDELEFVYEKSRDISYENPDFHDEKFNEKISKLVASFKNDEINTFTVGNQEETWETVTKSTQTEIYQIIRELLVNMKKHSEANNVVFKFEKTNNLININYADNGIGISDELIFKNGLSNTVSRIENINGKITFETKTEKGLKVNISFPVS